jgi:hypothetical protein
MDICKQGDPHCLVNGGNKNKCNKGCYEDEVQVSVSNEVSLRDYFAAKAMQGIFAGWDFEAEGNSCFKPDSVAKRAYLAADAMLKAREA